MTATKTTTGEWIILLLTAGICVPQIGAFWIQFGQGEFPCPICLLQRLAMLGIAIGAMMNLRFGVRTSHYAISIFSALFGAAVSTRQILLHIVPGNPNGPGYGSAVFGFHLYTWGLIIFMATIGVIGLMMFYEKHFEFPKSNEPRVMNKPVMAVFALVVILTAGNVLSTFLMCGLAPCPDNPDQYIMLTNL
ncbi:MAG: disulfide bond formation protein B [Rubripirellula sp.]|nr:disulfide bond formation protein B [Rubripirellula sp.]